MKAFLILAWTYPSFALIVNLGPMSKSYLHLGSHPSCSDLLFKQTQNSSPLGDFRQIARLGLPIPFRQVIPHQDEVARRTTAFAEIEYELEIKNVRSRGRDFKEIIDTLVEKSILEAGEREVGAFTFFPKSGGEPVVVYFTSGLPDRIGMEIHQQAMIRFFTELNRLYPHKIDGTIERLHTHPSYANEPHGAADVLEDVRLDKWLAQSRFKDLLFRSHVIPLNYGGDIYCEFEPRRHRTY